MLIKSFAKLFLFAFTILLIQGCSENSIDQQDTIHGSGNVISETRDVSECDGIIIKNLSNVILTQGNEQSIRIQADDNIIKRVLIKEENGNLIIQLKDDSYSNITLNVFVTLKTIKKLSVEGAGNINCSNSISSQNLDCTLNGAGNINLIGTGENIECILNGAGNINAKEYLSKNCNAVVNGAGICSVNVSENLNASVTGVGTIIYYGNPKYVRSSVSGIGQVIEKNN